MSDQDNASLNAPAVEQESAPVTETPEGNVETATESTNTDEKTEQTTGEFRC